MDNLEETLEKLFLLAKNDNTPVKEKIDALLAVSTIYLNTLNDYSNALKYAYIAASMTYSPRADICCVLGNIYTSISNYDWAELWYKKAICNTSDCDASYTSIIPFQSLANLYFLIGNSGKAKEYASMVLSITPENNDMEELIKSIKDK